VKERPKKGEEGVKERLEKSEERLKQDRE